MLKYIVNRLKEPSTFAGLAIIAGAFGVSQPLFAGIAGAITGVAGLAAVLMGEGPKEG